MKILITGASGFLGSNFARALSKAGHRVTGCVRDIEKAKRLLPGIEFMRCDFNADLEPADWAARLEGVDVVINAVGIIKEAGKNTFKALHADVPKALFKACESAGIKKVIQISAAGTDASARSRYHLTKKEADDYLTTLDIDWVIVKPSVVFGPGGKSAELFTAMSALPFLPLVDDGCQKLQPVYVEDLVKAVVALVEDPHSKRLELEAVGPEPMTFKQMLSVYRRWLGIKNMTSVSAPLPLAKLGAWFGNFIPGIPIDSETLQMLQEGKATGDPGPFAKILGQPPKSLEEVLSRLPCRPADRLYARLFFIKPLLRFSIAFVWIAACVISAFIYSQDKSYELLSEVGVSESFKPLMLYGASMLDFIIGLAVLSGFRPRLAGMIQLAVIVVYSLIITFTMPEFLAHPFGPVIKNIPLVVAVLVLMSVEEVE